MIFQHPVIPRIIEPLILYSFYCPPGITSINLSCFNQYILLDSRYIVISTRCIDIASHYIVTASSYIDVASDYIAVASHYIMAASCYIDIASHHIVVASGCEIT